VKPSARTVPSGPDPAGAYNPSMFEILPNWHPIFVKFGYALSVSGAMLGIALCLGLKTLREPVSHFVQIALALGAVALAFTMVTGFWAWTTVEADGLARAAMAAHRNAAVIAVLATLVVAVATLAAPGLLARRSWSLALLTSVILLSIAAARGAEVVYRHGVGVVS
jgi:uncharacterized membrane protein